MSKRIGKKTRPQDAPEINIDIDTIVIWGNKINVELHNILIPKPIADIVNVLKWAFNITPTIINILWISLEILVIS